MRRRLWSLGLFGLLGLIGVYGVASASSAASPPTWGNASKVAVPGSIAKTNSVSCGAAGACAAGGVYLDVSGHLQAFVVDETNGSWGAAISVPGIAALNSGGNAWVTVVSCATAGNCAAGGYYTDASSNKQPFVVNETNGNWGTAIQVPGAAAENSGGSDDQVKAITCPTPGNCTAVGNNGTAFVVTETNGTWASAIQMPGAQDIGGLTVTSVSCATPGNCAAGGSYVDGASQAWIANKTNGTWGAAVEVPGTAALNATPYHGSSHGATVYSVSCPTAGNCAAGGKYEDSNGRSQSFVVDETNGSWGTAVQVLGAAALNTGGFDAGVKSISCVSAGNCAAGGDYTVNPNPPSTYGQHAFVVTETNGTWAAAIEVPGTAALNTGGYADVRSISCTTAGNCSAGGEYSDGVQPGGNIGRQAFVINETNGSWGTAIEVPGTAALNTGDIGYVDSISCAAAGYCAAGGHFLDASGNQGFVVDSTPTLAATSLVPASASGTYGGIATISATLTSGGTGVSGETVSFTLNGATVGGATTNANGVATLQNVTLAGIGAGSYPTGVAASFAGDGDYHAGNGTSSLTVSKAAQAIAISTHAPTEATYGDQFTVSAAGGGSGNAILYGSSGGCTNSGATYTINAATACTVTYDQAGDSNYTAAPELTESVNLSKADQTIHITTGAPSSAAYGAGFTVAATGGGSGNPVTYGASGSCTNDDANFTMTSGTGTCTVTYNQAGDDNHDPATQQTETVTAEKADQAITFVDPGAHTYGAANFDPGATGSSGLAVSYGASGACAIVGGTVHLTGAGSCTVTASQGGNTNYSAALQVQRTFSVGKAALSITANSRQKFYGQSPGLGATAFTLSGLVGSDSVSGVTLTSTGVSAGAASGNYAITASGAVAGAGTNLGNYAITYQTGTLHVLAVGIIGLNGVTVAASAGKIDSFDSTLGAYGASNHGSAALVMSNGPLSLSGVTLLGSAESMRGSVSIAPTASVSGNVTAGTTASVSGTVGGSVVPHAPTGSLSLPTVAACSPKSAKHGINGGTFTYASGNLTVKSGTAKLATGTYCFTKVALDVGAKLQVSGPVTINLTGKLTGKGTIVNTTSLPSKLHIQSSFNGSGGVAIVGNGKAAMTILAPETSVAISGGSFFGTLHALTVRLTGGTTVHADMH